MVDKEILMEIVYEKTADLSIPGFIVETNPYEADVLGAFVEEAISEEEAMEAVYD